MLDGTPTRNITARGIRIPVLVSPMSCGDEVVGWRDGALKMRVVAGGADGREDDAVESLLAEVLCVERDRVRVVDGRGARRKWIEIDGYDEDDLDRRLPGRTGEGEGEVTLADLSR